MIFLGLDVGTAGSKATAIDHNGNIHAYAYGEYPAVRTNQGFAEIDPLAVWNTVKSVIAQAAAQAKEPIKAIAVASFGESFVAMDKNDHVLRNSLLFADVRGAEETGDILEKFSEQELYDITGMPVNAMFSLNKLLWLKKHEAGILENTDKLLFFEDYIYYMLSGVRCVDYSLASRSLFFDYANHIWSERILKAFGLNAEMLSTPVPTGSVIGTVRSGLADELGLTRDVLLVAGAHDQVCAALGAGVLHKGESVDGIGTSECITACLGGLEQKEFMRQNNFCIEPYALPGEYVTLAFSSTGASLLGWFCSSFAKAEQGQSVFELMENECPDEPTNLFVLPHLTGSGTPYMDPYSTGAILGLRLNTTRGDIYKACIEGLCFEMMQNAELLKSMGTHITSITCVGGGARSELLLQVKADIMGIPVKRLKAAESGTIALAMLCATACEQFKDLEEAAGQLVKIDKWLEPDKNKHDVYLDRYSVYKKIYPGTVSMRN